MDEKNANGEINANESVKQLSDGNAQSVESEAEAREFDVVTEKPAQRQEKKTKNAAKRPSGKQRSETTQVVTKTAGCTCSRADFDFRFLYFGFSRVVGQLLLYGGDEKHLRMACVPRRKKERRGGRLLHCLSARR